MKTRIYFWRIRARDIPWAITRMALDRRILKRNSAIKFWKLLGTGKGETFTPKDADAQRWGLIVRIEDGALADFEKSRLMTRWNSKAISSYSATLGAISAHGSWSKHRPFPEEIDSRNWDGQVAAITRARIKSAKNLIFWRAVPPVTAALKSAPGLVSAIGIGEAPLGLQGTFSIWQDPAAIRDFAYRGAAHRAAIEATAREKWYAEELFARFAIIEANGAL